MRAAPLSRCTVTGVTAAVSVPRVLGFPTASPAAASVGAWARLGEDVAVRELCDLILPIKFFLGAPEIFHLNFGMGSKKHGFFRVCGHRPRTLLGQNFNMAKGVFKRLLSL